MSAETPTTRSRWSDPRQCPFCGSDLDDGGAGFVRHVEDRPECESRFETWRRRVGGDMAGG
jgi:hypothetical protein